MPQRAFSSSLPTIRSSLFINNEWVETAKSFPVEDPATGKVFMHAPAAGAADVDAAVKAARACFHSSAWGKRSTGAHRAEVLRKMGSALKRERDDFARLESLDNGKPLFEAEADIDTCVDLFDYFAGLAEKLDTESSHGGTVPLEVSDEAISAKLRKEPYGVIGAVTPWNFPLMQAVVKVAPAMAAGCTMVLKPSEVCPATCLRLGDIALEAGLPPGALNVLSGTGTDAGQPLLDHRGVDRLSFTGSGRTGHRVLEAASQRLIPASVELGGKSAILVFDDVDVDATVDWIMCGIYICTGQICSATSRLLVQDTIYPKLIERLVEETKKLKVGSQFDEDTKIGPLVNRNQLDMVNGAVERAKAAGAKVLVGGHAEPSDGYFYPPTILDDVPTDSEAWQSEIFGPVLAVRSFATEEEAIAIANDTVYGLANAVCTADEARSARVAEELHSGVVWQNCSQFLTSQTPFGGFKESGFGKEYGEMGLEEYLKVKTIIRCDPKYSWEYYVPRKQ